jgi:hypothetical protein
MPSDARTPRGVAGGAEALSGLRLSRTVPSQVRGAHAVLRGSGKKRICESASDREVEEREGCNTVWIARDRPFSQVGADTAVAIEREVVFGHAYAILAPQGCLGQSVRTRQADAVSR